MRIGGEDLSDASVVGGAVVEPRLAGAVHHLRHRVLPSLLRLRTRRVQRILVPCGDDAADALALSLLVQEAVDAVAGRRGVEVYAAGSVETVEAVLAGEFWAERLVGVPPALIEDYSELAPGGRRRLVPALRERLVPVEWTGARGPGVWAVDAICVPALTIGSASPTVAEVVDWAPSRLRHGGLLFCGALEPRLLDEERLVCVDRIAGVYRVLGEMPQATPVSVSRRGEGDLLTDEPSQDLPREPPIAVDPANEGVRAQGQHAALLNLSRAALLESDLVRFFRLAVETVSAVVQADITGLLEGEPSGDAVRGVASVGVPLERIQAVRTHADGPTLAGLALASDEPIVSDEVLQDPRFVTDPVLVSAGARCALATTIRDGVRSYGVMGCFRARHEPFDELDVDFVRRVSDIVGAAVSRARERRRSRVEFEIARILNSNHPVDELVRRVLHQLGLSLDALVAECWTPFEDEVLELRQMVVPGREDLVLNKIEPVEVCRGETAMGRAWHEVRTLWLTKTANPEEFHAERREVAPEIRCGVVFPVMAGDRLLHLFTLFFDAVGLPDPTLFATLDAIGRSVGEYIGRVEAESDARQSRDALSEVIAHIPELIALVERDGAVAYTNGNLSVLGLVERNRLDFSALDADSADEARRLLSFPETRTAALVTTARGKTHLRWQCVPFRGRPSQRLLVVRDVTEEERARRVRDQLRKRLELAQEASQSSFWTWEFGEASPNAGPLQRQVLGVGADAALTFESISDAIFPEDRTRAIGELMRQMSDPERTTCYVEYRVASDPSRWVASRGRIERDERGEPLRVLGMSVDITEMMRARRQVEQSEARFRAAVTATPGPLALLGASGKVLEVSDAFERIFQCSRGRSLYDVVRDAFGLEHATRCRMVVNTCIATTTQSPVMEMTTLGPEPRTWQFRLGQPLRGPSGRAWLVVSALDVTEHRRYEERLRRASEQKDELMAMLGHELRNPLAAMVHAIDLIRVADDATRDEALSVLARQGNAMRRLVDDMFDASRFSRGKLALESRPVNLGQLAQQVVEQWKARFDEQGVLLELLAEDGWVLGDTVRLDQVLGNLMGNALKFTPAGGVVLVKVSASDRAVTVDVRDSGEGFASVDAEQLFEPFLQGPQDAARSRGGLGLGLAMVRNLVTLHGGSVSAHSDGPGRGAHFSVVLPTTDLRPSTPMKPEDQEASCCRVLLVEDHLDNAAMLVALLRAQGHDVVHVATGTEAIAVARDIRPCVVLCDIGLPDISGYDVVRALKSDPALARCGFVALSGYGEAADIQRALEAGFQRHITKPIRFGELQEVLAAHRRRT